MKRWMVFLGSGVISISLALPVHATEDSASKQIQMLNSQLQSQLQQMQEKQQKQMQTMNKQIQAQLKETQTKLQAQIKDLNKTTQEKMKAMQTTLHAEIEKVNDKVLTGGGAPAPEPKEDKPKDASEGPQDKAAPSSS
jgi:Skp family chaperone for outer membrane proteins